MRTVGTVGTEETEGTGGTTAAGGPERDERALIATLRAGDEEAFATFFRQHHPALVRIARGYVREPALAEEIAQEAWLGLLRGLDGFAGRSSLKTWLVRILLNRARTVARRERRHVPFSDLPGDDPSAPEALFGTATFDHPLAAGHWTAPVRPWTEPPDEALHSAEVRLAVETAVEALPPNQRAVVTLRDIEGWSAEDTCNALGLSAVHQRVLLHRARTKVRRALAGTFQHSDAR